MFGNEEDEDSVYVSVTTVSGPFEEAQVRSFLEGNGIPVRIRGEAIRKTHGITVDGIGVAHVDVPERFAETAREMLAAAERGDLRLDDENGEDGDRAGDES